MNCAAHIWCWPTSRADDGFAAGETVDFRHQVLRLDLGRSETPARSGCSAFHSRICVHQAVRAASFVRCASAGFSSASTLFSFGSTRFTSPTIGQVGGAVLADLGGIDVHVDHLGVRREGGQPAGDAVVEAHAERDQQVGIRYIAMLAA